MLKRLSSIFSRQNKTTLIIDWLDRADSARGGITGLLRRILRVLYITGKQFNSNNLSLRAGALTYTILLSLVPMLAMSTAVIKGLGGGNQLRDAAFSYINALDESQTSGFPRHGIPKLQDEDKAPASSAAGNTQQTQQNSLTRQMHTVVDTVFNYVDRTNFATLGSFGVIGMIFSVLLVLNHIESAMNSIWNVRSGRSILRKVADYITLLILFPLSINVAFAASAFLKAPALSAQIAVLIPFDWMRALLLQFIPIFFIALSFYIMFIFFPNTRVKTIPAAAGAFLAAFFWFAGQNIYISLQIGVSRYNAIYGSFATVPLFLVWLYAGWIVILLGAQFTFALQNFDTFQLRPVDGSPSLRLSSALDVMEVIYRDFTNGKKTTPQSLADDLPDYTGRIIAQTASTLQENNFIHLSRTENRYLPLLPQKQLTAARITETILGKTTPESPGGKKSREILNAACRRASEI